MVKDYSDDGLFCYTFRLKPRPHNLVVRLDGAFSRAPLKITCVLWCNCLQQMLTYKKGQKAVAL
jgi:hypothetical protein